MAAADDDRVPGAVRGCPAAVPRRGGRGRRGRLSLHRGQPNIDSAIDYKVNEPANHTLAAMTDLQSLAKQHLMLHFSDMTLDAEDIPILVRGEGCHVFDDLGNRYIDGLSGLYCTNLGHSHGEEIGAAAAAQMATLPFTTQLDRRPPAVDRARRPSSPSSRRRASSAPSSPRAGRSRSSRPTSSPSSGTQANGEPRAPEGDRPPRRLPRGHDSARSRSPGSRSAGRPSSRSAIPTTHVSNTNAYRHPAGRRRGAFTEGAAGRDRGGDRRSSARRRSR